MYSTDPIADQAHSILDWKGARATRQFLEAQLESVVNSSAEMLALLAEEAFESGEDDRARHFLGRALTIDHADPTALAVSAMVEGGKLRLAGTPGAAREFWERALAVPRPSWLTFNNLPNYFARTGMEDRGIELGHRAVTEYADSPHCSMVMAHLWDTLMHCERSDRALRVAQERFPTHHEVLCTFAGRRTSQLKLSERMITEASEQAPDHHQPKSSLAFNYLLQARGADAEALAKMALEIRPDDGLAMDVLKSVEQSRGNNAEALEWKRRLRELDPSSRRNFITDLCIDGVKSDPVETNRQLLEIEGRGGVEARTARFYRLLYFTAHSFVDTRKLLDEIEEDENRTRFWFVHKAEFVRDVRKPDEAIRVYREGLERFPQDGRLTAGLIAWLGLSQRESELKTELEKLRTEPPGEPQGLMEVARVLGQQRRFGLAKEMIRHGQSEFPGATRFGQVDLALDVVAGRVPTVYRTLKSTGQLSLKNAHLLLRASLFAVRPPYGSRD
ncbi:MAG: tetratricopeptide repeat protein [Fimbriimonadaceae bacterium]|nr:tetratricopeptide repeat protein [Fimbriimonadaceae bacterium]